MSENDDEEKGGSMMESESRSEAPDPDAIKMFVGQIPRAWDEDDCRKLFEEFGPIYQLNVLRDKGTNASRGCGFVTFYHRKDAIGAQNALHNVKTLEGMHHPVQMKPADGENRNERKLFVGMLSKTMSEEDVREMFKEFGHIEECSVLRENGKSRGCCFVTFASRSCAMSAIRRMNHSVTLEDCSKPLVVKFADTQKDKESRRPAAAEGASPSLSHILQPAASTNNNLNDMASQLAGLNALLQQPGIFPLLNSVAANLARECEPARQVPSTSSNSNFQVIQPAAFANLQQQQTLQAIAAQQRILDLMGGGDVTKESIMMQLLISQQSTINPPNVLPPLAISQPSLFDTHAARRHSMPLPSMPSPSELLAQNARHLQNLSPQLGLGLYGSGSNLPIGYPSSLGQAPLPSYNSSNNSNNNNNDQTKGPEGCNLFIYHLPQEYTDEDLYALFSHFGSLLSAKCFVDKQTNLSKCFGFVSFTNAAAAQSAISAMNGFQIGSKRLKVQLKRSSNEQNKPYSRVA